MGSRTRLFVGNLPDNTNEDDLKSAFSSFGEVVILDLKSKSGDEINKKNFAFVTISGSNYNIESCIKHFGNEIFNGNRLYVSRARESFLERLERERQEAKQQKTHEHKQLLPKNNPVMKLSEKLNPRKRRISDHKEVNGGSQHKVRDNWNKSKEPFVNDANVVMPNKKKEDSDKKRIDSLKKKRDEFKQKQMIIKSGLIGIDKVPNRKTKFSDSEEETHSTITKTYETLKNNPEKTNLFEDDADSDDEVNFEIKKQFEGKKGQKVLDLQSRYKSDKRFVLDERFTEDQSDEENYQTQSLDEHEQIETGEANEKLRQLNILQDVLGVSIKSKANSGAINSKTKKTKLGMLRFDPTQPKHAKFLAPVEATNEPLKKAKKKKSKEKQEEPQPEVPIIEQPKIEVSKEQFYKVSETLKETIAQPTSFSLRSLFGQNDDDSNKKDAKDKEADYIPLIAPKEKKVKNPFEPGQKNPFVYDSSDSESESDPKKQKHVADTRETLDQDYENEENSESKDKITEPIKQEVAKAVWRENLFFTEADNRLKEGVAFFNKIPDNEIHKERRELKSLMKKRIYNKQRKNQMFQKKIGGRKKVMKKPYNKRKS